MARDPQSLLDDIEDAIAAVTTGGVTMRSGGRELTMADLPSLMDARTTLKKEIAEASANGGSMCSLGVQGPLH